VRLAFALLLPLAFTAAPAGGGAAGSREAPRLLAPAALSDATRARLEAEVAAGFALGRTWVGIAPAGATDPLDVEYLPSHEAMGLRVGMAQPWLYDAELVRVLFIPSCSGGSGADADERAAATAARNARCAGLFAAVVKALPSSLRTPWADALAATAAEDGADAGDDATRTARDLRSIGLLPELAALLHEDPRRSPEITRAAGVSLLRALPVETRASDFAALVAASQPEAKSGALAADCSASIAAAWKARLDAAPPTARTVTTAPTGLRGFCFSHEGYRWVDGYGSRAAAGSLARLRELGVNAVSMTPYSFQREVNRPSIGMLFEGQRRGFAPETDLSVEVTCADAADLTVVLKPHLWCGHGHWCGEISMAEEADWPRWFAEYERLAVHEALIARRLRIPILCIGTELKGTTGREEEWRALILKLRALHPGLLTYCANWGDEVERLGFWDALDAIGVSDYWPLADAPGADDATIRARFDSVLERMRRLGRLKKRPVWFLETGFPDVRDAWLTPHENEGTGDGGVDQGRAYRIVLAASRAQQFPDGLFFWKWPSRAPRDDSERYDYWPWGRSAEAAVREAWRPR
jgi:glycosyl hydrolase family 113